MNRLYRFIGLGLLTGLLCAGCGKSEEEAPEETAALNGNWLLTITQDFQKGGGDYRDVSTVLLAITQEDGSYKATIKGNKAALPRPALKEFQVNGNRVRLIIDSGDYTYDFQGIIQGDVVRGNVDQGGLFIEPALLVRKPIRDISEVEDFPLTDNHLDYQALLQSLSSSESESISLNEHYAAFKGFCEKHPKSALSVIVSHAVVNVMPLKAESEAEVKAFAKSYLSRAGVWGARMQMLAQFNIGRSLIRQGKFPDLGLDYLAKAESQLSPKKREAVQENFAYYREMAENTKLRTQAEEAYQTVKDKKSEAGLKTLRALAEKSPYDPLVMFLRAEAARLMGQTADAVKLYAQLATWPGLQATLQQEDIWQDGEKKLPEGLLLELWVKKHGSEEGLEDYKAKTYEDAIGLIAKQIGEPKTPPAGNRVNVMELFTGAGCRPCVGADMAIAALERIHPKSNLVVLRYHQNSAGLDPLTHPRGVERFQTLLANDPQAALATPSVFLNGQPVSARVGGFLDTAVQIGNALQTELAPALDDTTPLELTLKAYEHEDEITISAKLSGVPEEQKDKLRILLLLVEDEVELDASNGIRDHDMVVRWFYNEGSSLAISSGADFQFGTKISRKDIRNLLKSSTEAAAEEFDAKVPTMPLELDGLRLVALVHDAETREVLQAGSVPVEVYDTSPMLPMPKVSDPGPTIGPKLVAPGSGADAASDPKAATAEKPADEEKPMDKAPLIPALPK